MPKNTAIVLAGAVAQGAFEAGVLSVLAEHRDTIPVSRLAGASSGALNAAVYATGVRFSTELCATKNLVELWRHEADWNHVVSLSLAEVVQLRGLSTSAKILSLLEEAVAGCTTGTANPVDLRITLTTLRGETATLQGEDATTFEHSAEFSNENFDSPDGRRHIFAAAAGSAAFPGLFAPFEVAGVGPTVDGGVVNNAPIGWALRDETVDQVIVVSAHPRKLRPQPLQRGARLVGQLVDILINERLYRDLREAVWVNDVVRRIEALDVPPDVVARVLDVLALRHVDIVEIRPDPPLEGDSFSGFGSASQRSDYIDAGKAAAKKALPQLTATTGT